MSLRRMTAIARKELLHILRDPRNVFLVTGSPAFLLFLLAYVFSFDVGKLTVATLDMDRSTLSRSYLTSLASDPDLEMAGTIDSYDDALPLLIGDEADAVLIIPPGFAASINGNQPTDVQVLVNGADPNVGAQTTQVLETHTEAFATEVKADGSSQMAGPIEIRSEAWYNPGLDSQPSMVPGLLAIVLVMPTLATTMALTREKETGTLEGLMATPISGFEYVLGKLVIYLAMGVISVLLATAVAVLWFRVPFRGSMPDYVVLSTVYLLACMSAAILIAHVSNSQQTATFIVLLAFLVPSLFMAGLITPVSTKSVGSMLASYALPTTHFVAISRGVFLRGSGLRDLWMPALVLLGMGLGALALSLSLFRKRLS